VRALLLAAIAAAVGITSARAAETHPQTLLDRTVWIDIGIGRTLATMKPKEMAALKRCKEPTAYFEKMGDGLAETLYAGMSMRTEYPRIAVAPQAGRTNIQLYLAGNSQPGEILQLRNDGTVLVQQTRGFRPHILVRCTISPTKSKNR
jgi:hypothetical protein